MWVLKYIIIICFFANQVLSKDLYYSDEYEIQFISEDIKTKKSEFIQSIKYNSFKKLISSLLTKNEYENFKRLIDDNLINSFLFSIDINQEKINNNNYSSKIRIAFDNSKIINFFIKNKINFVPYNPEKFLLIIFDQKLFSEKILSKDNSFYEYLSNNKMKSDLFVVPNLDINDRYIIKKDDFLEKKITKYDQLLNKYNYKNILLVHSISELNEIKINSYFYKNNNFENIDKIRIDKINYELFFKNLQNKVIDKWKYDNIVNTSNLTYLKCRIKTLNLIELKKIKEIIIKNNMVTNLGAIEISYNNSIYELMYYGNLNILKKSLRKNKIELNMNNQCNIKII